MGINIRKFYFLPIALLVLFFTLAISSVGQSKENKTAVSSKEDKEWVVEFAGQKGPPKYIPAVKSNPPPSNQHKIIIYKSDKNFDRLIKAISANKILDYKNRVILIIDSKKYDLLDKKIKNSIKIDDKLNRIFIRGYNIDTTLPIPKVPEKLRLKPSDKKQLFIIQFAGPIMDKWRRELNKEKKIQLVTHIKHNSLLVFSNEEDVNNAIKIASIKDKIQWVGPYHPAYRISPEAKKMAGDKVMVTVQILPHENIKSTLSKLKSLSIDIFNTWKTKRYVNVTLQIPSAVINDIGALPDVIYIEPYNNPKRGGGRQANIMADMHAGSTLPEPRPAVPENDYLDWITTKLTPSGTGSPAPFSFVIDIADGGIDRGDTSIGALHSSFHDSTGLNSRLSYAQRIERTGPSTFLFDDTTSTINHDADGHGTLMASVAAGYPNSALSTDNYRHGLGLAPYALIGSSKIFEKTGSPAAGWSDNFLLSPTNVHSEVGEGVTELYRRAYAANARISVNSWGDKDSASAVYTVASQMIDEAVRDANPQMSDSNISDLDEMLLVFLAGNSSAGSSPNDLWGWGSVAKNTLVVGGSENYKQDGAGMDGCGFQDGSANSIQDLFPISAWGPVTGSDRIKPDLLAPATRIYGAATQASTYADPVGPDQGSRDPNLVCNEYYPAGQTLFTRSSGTSFAAPAVAGVAANLRQWLTTKKNRGIPSPALLKAWLMNSTDYLSGVRLCEGCATLPDPDALPSSRQGMGLLNINRTLDDITRFYQDQNSAAPFSTLGDNDVINGLIQNTSMPFRVTVAWTDESGDPMDGGSIVNDLNLKLSITDESGPTTQHYKGNDFDNVLATPATREQSISYASDALGNVDTDNNVESIWVPASTFSSGGPFTFQVTVTAATLNGDGVPYSGDATDQDFALVVYNGYVPPSIDLDLDDSSTTGNNFSTSFTEDVSSPVNVADVDVSITKVSITLASQPITTAIISIDSPTAGEVLNYPGAVANISASVPSSSITLTGSVSASIADFESAINQVTYNNTSNTPTTGNRTINVVLNDSVGNSNTAVTTVNVTATNDTPSATNDNFVTDEDTALPMDASRNIITTDNSNGVDFDVDGGTLVVSSINGSPANVGVPIALASGAMLTVNANGQFLYDPTTSASLNAQSSGSIPDSFTYTIDDGQGGVSESPSATVTIDVSAVNDDPVATNIPNTCAFGDTPIQIFLNGTDADGDTLTITNLDISSMTAAMQGTLKTGPNSGDPDALSTIPFAEGTSIYYHPPIIDNNVPPALGTGPFTGPFATSFSFDVNDGTTTDTATVNINVSLTCREPIDLALVLDFSGSMNQVLGSTTRVQEMQDSVRLFVDTWKMNQPAPEDGNDNIGLVTYNSTSQTIIPSLLPLESAIGDDADEVLTEMCNPDPMDATNCLRNGGGGTAMGLGLIDGYNMLSGSTNANRFIILLTDGMQNVSPLVTDDGGSFAFSPPNGITSSDFDSNNITVHTLGIGSTIGSAFLDTLENISDSTPGGVTHNTDNATDALPDMWQNTLVESLDANSLEMVGHDSGIFTMADQRKGKKHSYHLNKSARKATFVLYWKGDRRKDALQIALRHKPSGTFIPASTNGLRANDNSFYSIRHMDFPITLPDGTKLTGEGEWELFINGKLAVDSVNYQTWVMAEDDAVKYDFTIPKRIWTVGELVSFISSITDKKGKSIIKKVIEAKVNISAPSIGLGTFVATNKVRRPGKGFSLRSNLVAIDNQIKQLNLDPDSFNNAANKKLLLLLRDPTLQSQLKREFTTLDFKPAQQGKSIAKFDKTKVPGSYTVNISVKAIGVDGSIIQRTRRFSMRVEMSSIDRNNTFIDVQRVQLDKGNLQVQVTPIDKYGNYLGPGLSNKLAFNVKSVEKVGELVDNLDGSYTQNFVSKNLFGDTIKLKVLDTELVIETGIDPRVYWFIICILLLLVIFAFYKLLKK